jgi:hypothetical protein
MASSSYNPFTGYPWYGMFNAKPYFSHIPRNLKLRVFVPQDIFQPFTLRAYLFSSPPNTRSIKFELEISSPTTDFEKMLTEDYDGIFFRFIDQPFPIGFELIDPNGNPINQRGEADDDIQAILDKY